MKIQINPKFDEKLLQNYPEDPYASVCIITKTRRLNLQLAYLAIDSNFFANVDPDTREITLNEFQEQPLLRVIQSLYGQKLIANTISELSDLYKIIKQLQIDDYKANIEREILSKPEILDSLEFLEFSFANDILVNNVIQSHIDNKLKILQSNRNYLQLNKITIRTFQTLVQKFIEKMIQKYGNLENFLSKPETQIINHVMQNYFNRNNVKAVNYFKQQSNGQRPDMEIIWSKYHHKFTINETESKTLQSTNNSSRNTSQLLFVKNIEQNMKKSSQKYQPNLNYSQNACLYQNQMQSKKKKILFLQSQIKERDKTIDELQRLIVKAKMENEKQPTQKITKRTSGSGNQPVPKVIDQQQFLQNFSKQDTLSFLPNIKRSKKSRDYDQEDDFTQSSVFEPAFNINRKLPQMKQVRTMKKVTGVGKNKFLLS